MNIVKALRGCSMAALAVSVPPSAAWAENDAQTAAQAGSSGLEDIVVTAQRRTENLQRVPIAISSITADLAEKIGIGEPQAIAQIVPGLTLNRSAASAVPFLRGVGTPSSTIGNEPSVATFIDDIYVNNGAAAFFEFNNIEQVEVLKGPQGTLFGRNATGGVIHIRTRNPTHEPTADFSASYGNYNTYGAQAYVSTGLTETLAMNLSAYGKKQADGWGRNIHTGNDAYDGWGYGVRSKLLFDDQDRLTILLNGNYERRRGSQGIAGRVIPGSVSRDGYDPEAAGAGFYDITSTIDNAFSNRITQLSGKVTYDAGGATLVSITSYTDLLSSAAYDIDSAPVAFFNADIDQKGKTWTQEIQIISPDGSPVNWMLGAFYLKDEAEFDGIYSGAAMGALGGSAPIYTRQRTSSISGFGQVTVPMFEKTRLTLGLRYTTDKRRFDGFSQGVIGGTTRTFTVAPARRTFSNLTGRFAIDHQFTPDLLGYVSYNKGFKSGIFNLGGVSPGTTAAPTPANPEDLNAYAIGFKSEWFDRRLRLNVEGFYYDYKDIQVATLLVGSQVITNAGAAKMKGIDVELTAIPVSGLTLTGSMTYEDGSYNSFPGGPQNFPLAPNPPIAMPAGCPAGTAYPTSATSTTIAVLSCDLSGNATVNTPKLGTTLGAMYSFVAGTLPVDLSVSWSHKSSYYFETDNNIGVRQAPTDIVNASVSISLPDDRFGVRFWANNLTKEKYYSYITQSSMSGTKYSPSPPRTYGVTLSAHF